MMIHRFHIAFVVMLCISTVMFSTQQDTTVTLMLQGHDKARSVCIAGSFNNWNPQSIAMKKNADAWIGNVKVKPGSHTYKFVVDGNWIEDPSNPLTAQDGNGNTNSVLVIPTLNGNHTFTLQGFSSARYIAIAGTFNGWNENRHFMTKVGGTWVCKMQLSPGKHLYKFIVDGEWITDLANPIREDNDKGTKNSVLLIPSLSGNQGFTLKGFAQAKVVVLAGSFNGWSETRHVMVRQGDSWNCKINLRPGRYLYKFIVDGNWILDPANENTEDNEYGTGNSVLVVR